MQVSSDLTNCRELDGQLTFTSCTANTFTNIIELILAQDVNLQGSNTPVYRMSFESAVDLPMTVELTNDIIFTTAASEVRSTTFKATEGAMASVKFEPMSQVIGADTSVILNVTTTHILPKNGKLILSIKEHWN